MGLQLTQGDENPPDPPGESLPEGAVENSPGRAERSPGKAKLKSMSPGGATEFPKLVFDRAHSKRKNCALGGFPRSFLSPEKLPGRTKGLRICTGLFHLFKP
jgi:hypothetical protein